MGVDTVLVETYTMIHNHLYGKAFVRVPEDYIAQFSVHFYPDGSIREFNVAAMDPLNSSVPFRAASGAFEYRLTMNCQHDTCTYFNAEKGQPAETIFKHAAPGMNFVGGWVPFISLMEWNCVQLARSGKQALPLHMINHRFRAYEISARYGGKDSVLFGGPFIEYTRIKVDEQGRILRTNGLGTPWNYIVTKHEPIDIEQIAKRMTKTRGIGFPSPEERVQFVVQNTTLDVQYGRPYKRGRQIFGGVVPYDSVWRTGAGGATILTLENPIRIGKTHIPKGQYSLYTIPRQNQWILIFNKDVLRWPTDPNRAADYVSVVIPVQKVKEVAEQFTINIEPTQTGGVLQFRWDDVMAYTEFSLVKH
ncbi:hypothetical protein GCM10023187_46900 [Nibrella viscosa]|uniref:DUF2911 domain-containing protein n=2 Tax=Nibrella viscosa TaxID=1084524 RepID=A0ABP8KTY7_9BACT